jgi:hypothetical protein
MIYRPNWLLITKYAMYTTQSVISAIHTAIRTSRFMGTSRRPVYAAVSA